MKPQKDKTIRNGWIVFEGKKLLKVEVGNLEYKRNYKKSYCGVNGKYKIVNCKIIFNL